MAETTKTKILDINTGKAQKNVKSLKQVIKELRDEMALLEKGTAEYDAMSKKLADAMQKQREIAEAAKYSNRDIGATLGNIATVGAGAVGAINGVSAALQLVGVEGEDAEEALKNIQLTMALIQGMSTLDTALKAIKGLSVAFKGLNAQRITNTGTTLAAAGAETAEVAALATNTSETYKNIDAAKSYNEAQIQNTTNTEASTEALYNEAKGLEAVSAARQGDMTKLEQYRAELAKLQAQQAASKQAGIDTAKDAAIKYYEKAIQQEKDLVAMIEKGSGNKKTLQNAELAIKNYQQQLEALKNGTADVTETVALSWRNLTSELQKAVDSGSKKAVEDVGKQMSELAKAMSPEQLERNIETTTEEIAACEEAIAKLNARGDEVGDYLVKGQKEMVDAYKMQVGVLEQQQKQLTHQRAQQARVKDEILKTKKATDAETASINANTKAKQQNAGATNAAAGAEANLAKSSKAAIPLTTKIANGIKGMATAVKSFIAANPILLAIAAAIGAIAAGIAIYTKKVKEANKEIRLLADISTNVQESLKEEDVRLKVLLKTATDANEPLEERKKAVEELNKLVPNYNAQLDETTGKYTANNEALEKYITNLKQKMLLEAYEGKIKEYLKEQAELQLKINKIQNSGWNLFGWRIDNARKKIKGLDKDIEFIYDQIKKLDLSAALNDNKVETGKGSGVVKTVQEIYREIKAIFKDLWNTIFDARELKKIWNGVYSEVDIAMLNLKRIIKTSDVGNMLSEQFQKAVNDNTLKDLPTYKIDMEFVFNQKEYDKFGKELGAANKKLQDLMNDPNGRDEKKIKAMQEQVNKLKDQQAAYKQIIESAYKVSEVNETLARAERERIALQKELNQQAMVEAEYRAKARYATGDEKELAPIQKEIDINNLLIAQLDKKKEAREAEIATYDEEAKKKKDVVERIKKLNEEQVADDKKRAEAQIKIDEAQYSKRIKELELFYAEIDKATETEGRLFDNEKILKGFGTADFNTEVEKLQQQLQSVKDKMLKTQEFYQQQVKDGLMTQVQADMEAQAALTNLEEEASEKRIELAEAEVDRKIAAQEAYISAFQSISSEISQLLSAEMANVDQNSKEYRRMAYMQGIVDTTSGTLTAFMSGVKSGIPAPGNLILAGVMAALTFATGVAQLRNIKNNTLANSTSASPNVNFGSTYDTLTYQNQSDILSAIKDSKVYVLENEISTTQNRVKVRESNATF